MFGEGPPILVEQMLLNILLKDWTASCLDPVLAGVGRLAVSRYRSTLRAARDTNGQVEWTPNEVGSHGRVHYRIINPAGGRPVQSMDGPCPPPLALMARTGMATLLNSLSQTRAFMVGVNSDVKPYGGGESRQRVGGWGQDGLAYICRRGRGWQAQIKIPGESRQVRITKQFASKGSDLANQAAAKAYADG